VRRVDKASLMIAAPPERVYAAMVDPDALAEWLPPGGMAAEFDWFDLRPGGSYRLVLTYADSSGAPGKTSADTDVVQARIVDVVPGVRVVQAVDFVSDDPAFDGTMTMIWEVTAVEGGTRVEITAADVPPISRPRTTPRASHRHSPTSPDTSKAGTMSDGPAGQAAGDLP
jgi:uncharacterized protein YndB with AHSA1/START domain